MGTDKIVYSAITGGKDTPRDDVLCFTEYDRFKDPVLNAKVYKVLPHLFLDTEWSVWIDGNLDLKVSPETLIEMTKPFDVGVFPHPWRQDNFQEAEEVKRLGLDEPERIDAQMARYEKPSPLYSCFLIVRRHTSEVARMNERWWAEITTGSRRDQLSFGVAYENVKTLPFVSDIRDNEFFTRKPHIK